MLEKVRKVLNKKVLNDFGSERRLSVLPGLFETLFLSYTSVPAFVYLIITMKWDKYNVCLYKIIWSPQTGL